MKLFTVYFLLILFTFNCKNDIKTKDLDYFLHSYGADIKDYRVVCIVPADGCSSCIDPSLDYSLKYKNGFLLVLSSIYKKSINEILNSKKLDTAKVMLDPKNLSVSMGLVSIVSPCYYFLRDGKIVKIADMIYSTDKVGVLKEVDLFLK